MPSNPSIQERVSRNCRAETRSPEPNPRECRRFSHGRISHSRDWSVWLGRQDSNLGMAESKSDQFPSNINTGFLIRGKYRSNPINNLRGVSKCAAGLRRWAGRCTRGRRIDLSSTHPAYVVVGRCAKGTDSEQKLELSAHQSWNFWAKYWSG